MTGVNPIIRERIRVAVAAYAYEIANDPIMSDAEFDRLALSIDTRIPTGNMELDSFFITKFNSATGQWVHNHPNIEGLKRIYETVHKKAVSLPPEPVQYTCRVCRKDTTINPLYGGCHC